MRQVAIEGNFVDVQGDRIFPARVVIVNGRISRVYRFDSAPNRYILPGLIDAHIHIESSLLCPSRFAEVAVAHGTTAVVSDPHEIANVLGMEGIAYMVEEARRVPLRIFYTAPSCIPTLPSQKHGGRLGWRDVRELLRTDRFVALGEVMNYRGVLSEDPETMAKLEVTHIEGKPADGHAPGLSGRNLERYIFAGISTDHECVTAQEASERHRMGMKVMVREGSASKNMRELRHFAAENECFLVSDDLGVLDLMRGHVDRLLARAVELGIDPMHAVRAVTIWPAQHYSIPSGAIREQGIADLTIVSDLKEFRVLETWIDGELVARDGTALFSTSPGLVRQSIRQLELSPVDLEIRHRGPKAEVEYVQAVPDQIVGGLGRIKLDVVDGVVTPDVTKDVLLLAVVNRYVPAQPVCGFIRGIGLKGGAIASSVAHDAHNIIGVGTNPRHLAHAMNSVAGQGGGYFACDGSSHRALPLPIAGLMSDRPGAEVARMQSDIDAFVRGMGCGLPAPFMTLSFQDPEFRKAVMGNSEP